MRVLSKTHQSSLTLKGGSTSHLGLLPSEEKRKPLLLVALNHFILWLADHQRSTPVFCAGWDRMDTLFRMFAACSMQLHRLVYGAAIGLFLILIIKILL